MGKHTSESSEDPAGTGDGSGDDAALYESVSSDDADDDGGDGGEAGNGDDDSLFEDGFDVATHGGGELESAPGFEFEFAMTEGFERGDEDVSPEFETMPRSCDLEFDEPESVCGRDGRVRITATTRIPWRIICQLIITRRDGGRSRCTGWFIGPRTVMTAGHCVFSHSGGGWARSIEVVPGMDASRRPFGSQDGTSFRSVRGWTRDRSPNHDYGAIILPDNRLGRRVGWFGFAALSDASLKDLLVNNSGYPGDKPFGTQWYNAGRITHVTKHRLYYMLDTAGGQSGSPTWRYRDGKRHAVGIHAYGGCPNKSTRINRQVFNVMKGWKALGS